MLKNLSEISSFYGKERIRYVPYLLHNICTNNFRLDSRVERMPVLAYRQPYGVHAQDTAGRAVRWHMIEREGKLQHGVLLTKRTVDAQRVKKR